MIHEAIAAHPDAVIHGWEVGDDVAPVIVGDDHLGKFGQEFDALGDHPHASFWPVWPRDDTANIIVINSCATVACALAGNGLPTITLARTVTAIAAKLVRNNSLVLVIVSFPE